jgi:hypothetical protein
VARNKIRLIFYSVSHVKNPCLADGDGAVLNLRIPLGAATV